MLLKLPLNTAGRDILVGDVHGYFTKLEKALDAIGFNPEVDRCISVGDLVDRGPESEQVVDWLRKPGRFAVRGNHEQMVLDLEKFGDPAKLMHMMNGGSWFAGMTPPERVSIIDALAALPIAIEIQTADGLVGVVHAGVPSDNWQHFTRSLTESDDIEGVLTGCLWSRDRIDNLDTSTVDGVRAVVVGHTPMERHTSLGNVHFIDTGAWLPAHRGPREFTLLDAATLRAIGTDGKPRS